MDEKTNKERYMEEGNTVREEVRWGMKVGGKEWTVLKNQKKEPKESRGEGRADKYWRGERRNYIYWHVRNYAPFDRKSLNLICDPAEESIVNVNVEECN